MTKPKYAIFLNDLNTVLQKKTTSEVKFVLGDSILNNRVLTVSQVIRFLTRRSASTKQRRLGNQLANAYQLLKEDILVNRSLSNYRTDAIDINEFINTYTELVIENNVNNVTGFRRVVSRALAA